MSGVLVTGATTPLGRALVRAFLDVPSIDHVVAVGAEPEGLPAARGRLTYAHVDLTRPRRIRTLLFGLARDFEIDTLVHTAMHRSSAATGRRVHALNVDATREILKLAESHPTIQRFVFKSHHAVYECSPRTPVLANESHPIDLSPDAPQWVRDRVEADVTVCVRMGLSDTRTLVLRCAEIFSPQMGSQLWDYLQSRVCLRPFGFNPMLNILTIEDTVRAFVLASRAGASGVFNIPGADTLPLSRVIELCRCRQVPLPGRLLAPLYRARARATGLEFRYDLNQGRFHFSTVLDGARAKAVLGYEPTVPIDWPHRAEIPEPGPSPDANV